MRGRTVKPRPRRLVVNDNVSAAAIIEALSCGKAGCHCRSAVRAGKGNVHCPSHADPGPSLPVNEKDGKLLAN